MARPSGTTPATRRSARRSTPGGCRSRPEPRCRGRRRSRTAHRTSATPTSSAARTPTRRRKREGGAASRPPLHVLFRAAVSTSFRPLLERKPPPGCATDANDAGKQALLGGIGERSAGVCPRPFPFGRYRLVLHSDQAPVEPPLDDATDERAVAPAVRRASADAIVRVVDVLEKSSLSHAKGA